MATTALGPTMAGGLQPIVEDGLELIYLPDVNNDALQREGKSPVFYWLPNYVHIARKGGTEAGDFMFNLIRFAGVQSADTTVGAEGTREVAGGVLSFTVTSAPTDRALQVSQQKIIQQWSDKPDFFWGIRGRQPPVFRPAIITSNITTVSNVSPIANRGIPTFAPTTRDGEERPGFQIVGSTAPRALPAVVRDGPVASSNLEPWYWQMQGQGAGSIDPSGQNAYSALIGAYPTAILWEAFHGTSSPIVVIQNLKLKVWSPVVELTIRGNWDRVFEHFSAAVSAHYLWASADIKVELNKMRMNGTIEVDVKVDQTLPNADRIAQELDKRSDLVFQKFMEQAQKVIFEPPQPSVQAAEASSGSGFWGVGVALKYRRDTTRLDLYYHETRQLAYNQEHTISSSMEGMYSEMKQDPSSEKKYFLSVFLDDWPRKLGRVFKPVVNWQSQPIAFLSAQVGYPNTRGELQWTGTVFQKTDGDSATWKIGITQKTLADVARPPEGWKPDLTYIKRKVHLLEPGDGFDNPFVRNQIEQDVIDLDPEPNGTPLNDVTLEVRADSAGRLAVGPIGLGAVLEDARQTVEVTFEPTDDRGQPVGREAVRFQWAFGDQDQPRYWAVYTGDPTLRPFFRYKVLVVIKGSLFAKGMSWEGPWVESNGNGPMMVVVPQPDSPGVVTREAPPLLVMGADGQITRAGAEPQPTRELPPAAIPTISGWSVEPPPPIAEPEESPEAAASRTGPQGNGHDGRVAGGLEVTHWHS